MSDLDLRPSDLGLSQIPYVLEQLHIMDETNEGDDIQQPNDNANQTGESESNDYSLRSNEDSRVIVLGPHIRSLENSLVEHIQSSIPSLDEIVIRQRGRKKQPAKISWSPAKSPFRTPTKHRNSALHMSLLSPSPAKKLFNNSASPSTMMLRNSPRKRILNDSTFDQDPSTSSTPVATPTKRMKFFEDRSLPPTNNDVPLGNLLKSLSQDQLIKMISDFSSQVPDFETYVRRSLPLPDLSAFEEQLNELRRNITRSSPRSRLMSKTDGAAFSRAASYLAGFKKSIAHHCRVLMDANHFNSLIEYILIAWNLVRSLPIWDETAHNMNRRECFKILTLTSRSVLKNNGTRLSSASIANFMTKIKSMANDFDEIGKCQELLQILSRNQPQNA